MRVHSVVILVFFEQEPVSTAEIAVTQQGAASDHNSVLTMMLETSFQAFEQGQHLEP